MIKLLSSLLKEEKDVKKLKIMKVDLTSYLAIKHLIDKYKK